MTLHHWLFIIGLGFAVLYGVGYFAGKGMGLL